MMPAALLVKSPVIVEATAPAPCKLSTVPVARVKAPVVGASVRPVPTGKVCAPVRLRFELSVASGEWGQ